MEAEIGALGLIVENDVEVVVRDGTVLRANVFRPDAKGTFPGLLLRTPYGKPAGGYERFVRSGYVVVTQDTRGRNASDGVYIPYTVEETPDAEDGYDSVEWLAEQPYCNGKVGTFGASYNAWMQWRLAMLRPPHLLAMCAYSIPLENTEVDWWGSFRPGRRIKWWMSSMAPDIRRRQNLPGIHSKEEALEVWDELENMRWLGFLPWLDFPKYLPKGMAEYAEDWLRHPNRRCWKFDEIHDKVEVPNLDFSGWYDHCGGTMAHLGLMQKNGRSDAAREHTKLIIGPWNHSNLGGRKQGEIDFGPEAELDLHHMMVRWFDRWLKDVKNDVDLEPPVRYFVMGVNQWRSDTTWPPEDLKEAVYHLDSNGDAHETEGSGALVAQAPASSVTDAYTYDSNDPVPTIWTRALFTEPADRRRLHHRQDILIYRSAPLAAEVETVGYSEVVLYAATTAKDTDFFARLVDEHPDGPALEISYGMIRARHCNTIDREEFITPGEVVEYRIKLLPTACRFLKGHRIRLEITSSDFPNHDRNHNTGGDDLSETELATAVQTIFHDADHPSRLKLKVT